MGVAKKAARAGTREGAAGNGIQVVARAVEILRALHGERDGLSLSQLSRRSGLPRSTVHRLVTALQSEGLLVAVSAQGRVRIGPQLMQLALSVHREIQTELRPELEALSERINETVDLSVLEGTSARFVDQVAAPQRLRAVSAVGTSFPAYCTANGKAMLAELSQGEVVGLIPPRLRRLTPYTRTSRAELLEELQEIRETGVAFDRQEHTEGIAAIGIAIHDPVAGLAAISIPMPSTRFETVAARAEHELRATAKRCRMRLTGGAA